MSLLEDLKTWKKYKDNIRDNRIYLTDKQFNQYFELVDQERYIAAVFDILNGEYGFERQIHYENWRNSTAPLLINYNTLEMEILSDVSCEDVKIITEEELTIITDSYLVTTSSYLKPIYILLFSSFRLTEGVSYVLNNMVLIASSVLPYFVKLKQTIDCEVISMPFSIIFFENLPLTYKLEKYHSQVTNKVYRLNVET